MGIFEDVDLFLDADLIADPHPYFDHLRMQGPASLISREVVAVTGFKEGMTIYQDTENFSSINVSFGPIPPMPFTPEGDDITDQIERHRAEIPGGNSLVALDPPNHKRLKSLLMGIITPKRFKENEEFLWRLADQQIDEFIGRGSVEVISEYARPFTTLAVADLLGTPPEDFDKIRNRGGGSVGQLAVGASDAEIDPLMRIAGFFMQYIEERRREPRGDVLSQLALARFPDGTLPPWGGLVSFATLLFAAGGDTTSLTIAAALRILAEDPELQDKLRNERERIADFVEEVLRLHGTVRSAFRLTKKAVTIGDLTVPPGTVVMLLVSAMNRDPRRFENPHTLLLDRKRSMDHAAFGRGIHACAGASLARAELKVTLERMFSRMGNIRIDEEKHGSQQARRYDFMPSYVLQGLNELHLTFDQLR